MGTTTLRRLGYVVGLVALGSAWIVIALVRDRLSPDARGWVDGAKAVFALGMLVTVWRFGRTLQRRDAVELAGRKARWLAKHPDSVVGRG